MMRPGTSSIEPDTLLVHPGETITAAATLTLEHTGQWPARRPDRAVPHRPGGTARRVPGRRGHRRRSSRSATWPRRCRHRRSRGSPQRRRRGHDRQRRQRPHVRRSLGVGGRARGVHRPVARSAARRTAPRASDSRRARSLLWRGDPVQHPFVVTVSPEGGQSDLTGRHLHATARPSPVGTSRRRSPSERRRWWPCSCGSARVASAACAAPPAASTTSATPSARRATPPPEPEVRVAIDCPFRRRGEGGRRRLVHS